MGLSAALKQKLLQAAPTGGGTYIRHGSYLFVVDTIDFKLDGFKGSSVVIEFFVKLGEPSADGKVGVEGPHNPTGSKCSYVCNLTGGSAEAQSAAQGNLKAFVIGMLGQEGYDAALGNEKYGPTPEDRYFYLIDTLLPKFVRGYEIKDTTYLRKAVKGPNAGKEMVGHKWSHVETSDEQVEANIALMSGGTRKPVAESAPATA